MTEEIDIRGKTYITQQGEFQIDNKYEPLVLRNYLSILDREVFIIRKFITQGLFFKNIGRSHGNYVWENVKKFNKKKNIHRIFIRLDTGSRKYSFETNWEFVLSDDMGYVKTHANKFFIHQNRYLYVQNNSKQNLEFLRINSENQITLDNLIHLTLMVKNSGSEFPKILKENLQFVDKITVLDTGSLDNTPQQILDTLKTNNFTNFRIYQEPFVNFGVSRNRLMDLAIHDFPPESDQDLINSEHLVIENATPCQEEYAFQLMLDDTYIIQNGIQLRNFLGECRSDEKIPSLSLYINSGDVLYSSNRIIRPESRLRYKYRIHEIIDTEISALIPVDMGFILDIQNQTMVNRTLQRKSQDLVWLQQEIDENPEDPRNYYYMAETHLCMKNWEKAYYYYKLRINHNQEGFTEEKYDAMYKKAVCEDLYLNYNWSDVMKSYLDCYQYNNNRPESMFMIGYHYFYTEHKDLALLYLTRAFEIHLPPQGNMNIKFEQANKVLPNLLIPLCYEFQKYELGIQAVSRLLSPPANNNNNIELNSWLEIFILGKQYLQLDPPPRKKVYPQKLVVFLSPGGWEPWDGETPEISGLGGSETFSITYAQKLVAMGYNVVVFCHTTLDKIHRGVSYMKFEKYMTFLNNNQANYCILNRYSNHLHILQKFNIPHVYLILHDIARGGQIIVDFPNLRKIICLTEWHKQQFLSVYPNFANKMEVISYGIDTQKFLPLGKIKYSFIYSSFPNRGLYHLLKMFPLITKKYPQATLNIFCDMKNKWTLTHFPQEIQEIQDMISEQPRVINHGWVNKQILYFFWSISQFWLYPCTFAETFCLTALEAAASKTLAITNDLGALTENVGDRGIIVPGKPETPEWKNNAMEILCQVIDNNMENEYIEKNYQWVRKQKYYDKVVNNFIQKCF